ncbi:MAG: monovalent cation/H(+) antiporter subunit G [Elusimicrobiota bacterium]|nr:monovalent cation/H(+) antiporter subunit G [Elusimicrobiota bacterium]
MIIYYLGMTIIAIGIFFDLAGCVGLIRFPDVYNRLQAATKCVTLGTCSILFGIFLIKGFTPSGTKALLVLLFVLLTSPTGAHALARGAYRYGVRMWSGSKKDGYSEEFDQSGIQIPEEE